MSRQFYGSEFRSANRGQNRMSAVQTSGLVFESMRKGLRKRIWSENINDVIIYEDSFRSTIKTFYSYVFA